MAWLTGGPAYPLKTLPDKHFVVDQDNVPFFIHGDSPWFLIQALDGAGVEYYLSNRWVQGFNSIILGLTLQKADGVLPYEGDIYGQLPFTNTIGGQFTNVLSWNERYFTNVDAVIRRAADYGICVFAYPFYDGYNGQTGYRQMIGNPTNSLFAFGRFIGLRYRSFSNIVWVGAGDYTEPQPPLWNWLAAGIRSADTNHLFTAQAGRPTPAVYYSAFVTLNSSYGSEFPYIESQAAYQRVPLMASFAREPYYEYRNITGTPFNALDCRNFAWWAILSGEAGHFFGSERLYPFTTGWQQEMSSPGAMSMTNVIRLMRTRPWHDCVPDANHTVVTSGYGVWGTRNYIVATRERTGKTVMVYIPRDRMTPTVDLSRISGSAASAWWYNPRDGSASSAGTYSTSGMVSFAPPDANDWVLVIDDASQNYGVPGQESETPLRIETGALPNAMEGTVYSTRLVASGGTPPYGWSRISGSWPQGITLATDGTVSGSPSGSGVYNVTVRIADSASATADKSLTLTVSASNSISTAEYITSVTPSRVRNDYSGYLGMQIAVGSQPVTVSALGRMMLSGNGASHILKLVRASDGVDVPGAVVSVNMAGGTPGQFKYVSLANPVTLSAGTAYFVASQETAGGDAWYDGDTVITTAAVAAQRSGVWSGVPGQWHPIGGAGHSYVPVSFLYTAP